MDWLATLFLYLHIGGAIVAFGPTIAFPFLAARAAKEPQHGNFVLRATEGITEKVVEPMSAFMFLMGVGLIVTRGYNPLETLWVGLAIVLFLITFAFANLVQLPTVRKMVAMTSQPPPAAEAAAAGPGANPGGPPPEFLALGTKAARGGQFMTLMLFVILALMVVKPF
ncbi:MAG: DUF2269 family protein [Chloroflexi bacterium]|nr:DUF2269 family protein [Chloroflexota bacterium]